MDGQLDVRFIPAPKPGSEPAPSMATYNMSAVRVPRLRGCEDGQRVVVCQLQAWRGLFACVTRGDL